jgi:hypothetical protein
MSDETPKLPSCLSVLILVVAALLIPKSLLAGSLLLTWDPIQDGSTVRLQNQVWTRFGQLLAVGRRRQQNQPHSSGVDPKACDII